PISDPLQDSFLFIQALGRNEDRDGPAHDFIRAVTENAFRALVPTGNNAVQVLADNRIVRRLDDGSQIGGGWNLWAKCGAGCWRRGRILRRCVASILEKFLPA